MDELRLDQFTGYIYSVPVTINYNQRVIGVFKSNKNTKTNVHLASKFKDNETFSGINLDLVQIFIKEKSQPMRQYSNLTNYSYNYFLNGYGVVDFYLNEKRLNDELNDEIIYYYRFCGKLHCVYNTRTKIIDCYSDDDSNTLKARFGNVWSYFYHRCYNMPLMDDDIVKMDIK